MFCSIGSNKFRERSDVAHRVERMYCRRKARCDKEVAMGGRGGIEEGHGMVGMLMSGDLIKVS